MKRVVVTVFKKQLKYIAVYTTIGKAQILETSDIKPLGIWVYTSLAFFSEWHVPFILVSQSQKVV